MPAVHASENEAVLRHRGMHGRHEAVNEPTENGRDGLFVPRWMHQPHICNGVAAVATRNGIAAR